MSLPAECQDVFEEYHKKHANGGVKVAMADTVEKCKESCIGDVNCLAIDFNIEENGCWIHVSAENVAKLIDIDGINHYKLESGETSVDLLGPMQTLSLLYLVAVCCATHLTRTFRTIIQLPVASGIMFLLYYIDSSFSFV